MSKWKKSKTETKLFSLYRRLFTGPNHNQFNVSSTTFANHNWRWACVKVKVAAVWRKPDRKALKKLAADLGCDKRCLCARSLSTSQTPSSIHGGMPVRRCCPVQWQWTPERECHGRSNAFAQRRVSLICCVHLQVAWLVSSNHCSESMKLFAELICVERKKKIKGKVLGKFC